MRYRVIYLFLKGVDIGEMKASTWKAVFAAMSPSPVFQAISEFAELRVNEQRSQPLKQIEEEDVRRVVRRRQTRKVCDWQI